MSLHHFRRRRTARLVWRLGMVACLALLIVFYAGGPACVAGHGLLAAPADDHDMTPLMRAAASGEEEAVRRALADGDDVHRAVRPHSGVRVMIAFVSWMQKLPERRAGYTALHFAVENGHAPAARVLIDHGADVNRPAEGSTPLEIAASDPRRTDVLRLLLRAGARVSPAGRDTIKALMSAAAHDQLDIVRILLAAGASPDPPGRDVPLIAAARAGNADVVTVLLEAGADPDRPDDRGWSAYRWAHDRKHADVMTVLERTGTTKDDVRDAEFLEAVGSCNAAEIARQLAAGANPRATRNDGRAAILIAANDCDEESVMSLVAAGAARDEKTADPVLYLAAVRGFDRLLRDLVRRGWKPQAHLVVEVARVGQTETLTTLLELGLDVNERTGEPLRQAARNGRLEAVELLLARGAALDLSDRRGMAAIDHAVQTGRVDITRRLIAAGADVNRAGGGGPPLFHAIATGNTDLVQVLLDAGADPNARDEKGRTPLEAAERLRNERMTPLLKRAMER